MNKRISIAFLLLVIAQLFHSVEEYIGKLWEVYAPARYLCSLISSNHRVGFIIIDTALILFGIYCWGYSIRRNTPFAPGLIWTWIVLESINVIGHSIWSISEGAYTPGLATVPLLLIIIIYLSNQLLRRSHSLTDK